jgi:flagellar protein FlaG
MTVSVNALSAGSASALRQAAVELPAALPAARTVAVVEPVREAAFVEREKLAAKATSTQVSEAVAEINQSLRQASIGVQFEFDKEANTMVTKVMDVESGEVIRQMPSEEVVRFSKALGKLQGLLVSQKV